MTFQLSLAWRYLVGRPWRTLLTVLAIVFGVMIVFGMQGIVPAVKASFDENLTLAIHQVDLILTQRTREPFDARVLDTVRQTPGVATVTGVLERSLRLPAALTLPTREGRPIETVVINGWDPQTSAAVIPIRPTQGRWLASDDQHAALVRESLLRRTGLRLGAPIRLPTSREPADFVIVGVLPDRAVLGDEEVYLPLTMAQDLFNTPGQINAVVALFEPGVDDEALRNTILTQLGSGYEANHVETGGSEWEAALRMGEITFTLFGVLALMMGGFIMFNTFRTSVTERRHDIGMLRAVGATRRTIIILILIEALVQGIVGTGLGILIGYGLIQGLLPLLNTRWEQFFGVPLGAPAFGLGAYSLTVGLGLGIPLLSSLLPALSASRVSPLEALRPTVAEVTWRTASRQAGIGATLIALALLGLATRRLDLASLGVVLFLAGFVLLGPTLVRPISSVFGRLLVVVFAREGLIAQGNLARQPGRAAVTVTTMMMSLAILVALAGLATTFTEGLLGYLDKSMRADYLLVPQALILGGQGNVGVGPELADRLRATEGVAAITTLRRSESKAGDTPLQVIGIDPVSYPTLSGLIFSAGEPDEAYARLGQGRAIIINGILAAQQKLSLGQTITLATNAGPQTYQIVGIGLDYLNSRQATAYISHANLALDFNETRDALLMANRAPTAGASTVEAALQTLTRDYPSFSLLSYAAWRQSQVEANQTRTNILYVLMALLAVPSFLALANTLSIAVLERTREIGILRAIGGLRGQVQRMIIAEGLLLSATGAGFGILAGVWLGYVIVGAMNVGGFIFEYRFPYAGILLTTAIGLVLGVLAALLPARHAARLDIVTALRYE